MEGSINSISARTSALFLVLVSCAAAFPSPRATAGVPASVRPETNRRVCVADPGVCIHWIGQPTGRPQRVEDTIAAVRRAWDVEVEVLGFKEPLSDDGGDLYGGTTALDIYLVDLDGSEFGSCESDDPQVETLEQGSVWAYCVLDDDYARAEYGGQLFGYNARKLTVAHELFHAIQMAYDFSEPAWLTEGTATWIEDEVYDGLNDNLRYLWHSPLVEPAQPLDAAPTVEDDRTPYGRWIFWRFLSETYGRTVVRRTWNHAADGTGALDATKQALPDAVEWSDAFRDFARANWLATSARYGYSEGDAYMDLLGQKPPLDAELSLSASDPTSGERSLSVPRLASRYVSIDTPRSSKLKVTLADEPRAAIVAKRGSSTVVRNFDDGTFSMRDVDRAVLVLPNPLTDSTTFSYSAELGS